MNSMQRPEVFSLVHRLLPGFELQTSDVSINVTYEDAGELAYRRSNSFHRFNRTNLIYRRIGLHRRIDYQQMGVSDSNVPHKRNDYHQSAYQIPTFNTTDAAKRRTGGRRPASRRIRFQRSTLKLLHRPIDYQQIGVSNSNAQNNRIDNQRLSYRIPTSTQQISRPANQRTGDRRPATGARRPAIGNRRPAHHVHQLPTVDVDKTDRRSLDQLRSIDGDRPSTPCSQR